MVLISLGSNIGNRFKNLNDAINLLRNEIHDIRISPLYESDALLLDDADESWNKKFLNMVISGNTTKNPYDLMEYIEECEVKLGKKKIGYWGPRLIDIDILLYQDLIIESEQLTIPHKEMHKRDFVIIPSIALDKDLIHSKFGIKISEIKYPDQHNVNIFD